MVDVFCNMGCDKTTHNLIHHHGSETQDMFVFDNCGHFSPFLVIVFTCSDLDFVQHLRWWLHHQIEYTNNTGIYLHEKALAHLLKDDFILKKSILAVLLRSFCCFSFDNWNLLSFLSL